MIGPIPFPEALCPAFASQFTVIAFGILIFVVSFRHLLLKRRIEDMPTSKIRSIAMGPVEVYGEVVPIKLIKSPYSGDCVYYELEYGRYGKKIIGKTPFLLRDETEKVLVDPEGCKFRKDRTQHSLKYAYLSEEEWSRIKSQINTDRDKIDIQAYEKVLFAGERIYVLGTAKDNPHANYTKKNEENVMISNGENNIFYMSDLSEKKTLSQFEGITKIGIIISLSMITFGLSVLLSCLALIMPNIEAYLPLSVVYLPLGIFGIFLILLLEFYRKKS